MEINWSGRAHDYTEAEIQKVVEVMKTADPQTQGVYLNQFESDFEKYIGKGQAFGVTNCTHALELAADLMGIGPGDEVIIPGHTYCASAIPFGRTGAKIRWADISPDSLETSFESVKALTNTKTKAVVVVHLYGLICPEINEIANFCKERNLFLLEDCAQSMGAKKDEKHSGTFGDFGTYSFHGQKNMTTMGEGGVLLVHNPRLAKYVKGLRHNGHAPFADQSEYWKPAMTNIDLDLEGIWPHNFSMSEIQAALGSMLLKRVDSLNDIRRERLKRIHQTFSSSKQLRFQEVSAYHSHSGHLLPAKWTGKVGGRDEFIKIMLKKYGVKTIVQYYPLYRYDLFKKMGLAEAKCPNTDSFFDNMVSIPFQVWMDNNQFEYLINAIGSALEELV